MSRVTLADSLLSSSARSLNVRRRPDLLVQRQRYQGKTFWIVKDPVGLHYFRFHEEEYAILNMLDGNTSLDQIKERFEEEFPPQKITLDELENFLGMLHNSGLILAAVQGQGAQLLKRRGEKVRQQLVQSLSNVLCLRFKGIDPERFLSWLYPKVRWMYSPLAVAVCAMMMLTAVMLILAQFDQFLAKLPTFKDFFTPANAFFLAVTLAVTKVIHEFGHGLTCTHFGGECHEMGVMILVLTPCLYCNVSDSWMLPNKWHRAWIGLGGIYIELVLASIATFFWWSSEPGVLNSLCLNVMFIASVSTIIFNGNPLLRYDGYYVLADLLEIPNLRQKATMILSRKAGEWFLGLEPNEDPFLPERKQILFVLFSVAAAVYRWLVVFSILWFLYRVFLPYRLEVIGRAIILVSLYGLFIQPLYRLGKFFYVPGRIEKVKKSHLYPSLAGIAVLVLAFLFVPLPYNVMATLDIQARDAASVFVVVPGHLKKVYVEPGQQVRGPVKDADGKILVPGQILAQLESPDLEKKIEELTADCQRYEVELRNRRHEQAIGRDSRVVLSMSQAEQSLKDAEERLEKAKAEYAKLALLAPEDGTVLPPPATNPPSDPEGPLPGWSGTPFLPVNKGAYLKEGTLFCQIGDPSQMEAVLVVDEADYPFVEAGQRATLKLDAFPYETIEGEITKISREKMKVSPRRLSAKAGGELATTTNPVTGAEQPVSTSYQASVPIPDPNGELRLGLRGRGKIHMDRDHWLSLGQRLWRFLTRTFHFRM